MSQEKAFTSVAKSYAVLLTELERKAATSEAKISEQLFAKKSWRARLVETLLAEFNPYHDQFGRFSGKGGGGQTVFGAGKAAGKAVKAAGGGRIAVREAIRDVFAVAKAGGKPPQLALKVKAKVEGGQRVLSTLRSNDGQTDYKAAGVLGMRQYCLATSRGTPLPKGFGNWSPDAIKGYFLATLTGTKKYQAQRAARG
jgi:hypothetical protein